MLRSKYYLQIKYWCESQGKAQFQKTLFALESLSERQGVAVAGDTDTGGSIPRT